MKIQWQNGAIVIGLIGAVFAIPKTLYEAWQTMVIRPKVEIYEGREVRVAYEPTSRLLTCSGAIVVLNSGNATEVIQTVKAHLGIQGDSSNAWPFSASDITLKEGGKVLPDAFPVDQGTSRTLTYEIKTNLTVPLESDPTHQRLCGSGDEAIRELNMELVGKKKPYQASFHFYFNANAGTRLFNEGKDLLVSSTDLQQ